MDIIVFDNGHLKFGESLNVKCISLKRNLVDVDDFNSWISIKLNESLKDKEYDLIVLPYSLSENDFSEFSGLMAAAYIRLNKTRNMRKPILFVGPEDKSLIYAVSNLSSILNTPYIFTTKEKLNNTNIERWCLNTIGESLKTVMTDKQYDRFLLTFNVQAPEKLGDRHSIANEWAVNRWSDMLNKPINISDNKSQLFYKLLRAKLGETEEFTKKWVKNHPGIAKLDFHNAEKYRIALIDDDYDKGWEELLKYIFEECSNIKLEVFKGFEKVQTQEDLVEKIEDFIDKTPADCYLLDLRLHHSDIGNSNYKELTGHIISSYILNKNKGNRVIIFTASNKVWNLKEEMPKGICGYSIKESPEQLLTRNMSYEIYKDFIQETYNAFRQAYIKNYVTFLEEYNMHEIDEFIESLLIDKDVNKASVMKSLILRLLVYIEDHIVHKFYSGIENDNNLYLKEKDSLVYQNAFGHIFIKEDITEVRFVNDGDKADSYFKHAQKFKDLTIVLAALHYYYGIPTNDINFYLKAKIERNRAIAHGGGEINLKIEDVKYLFENIVMTIIKKDYQQKLE